MADCRVDEVADGIYRISKCLPDLVVSHQTIYQSLVLADEPLRFHTGLRTTFPETVAAVARLVAVERLRWLSFAHVDADECGAMNHYLAAAPQLEVALGALGWPVSLKDMADPPPRWLAPGEAIDLGGRRVVVAPTPHGPHNLEAQVPLRGDDRHPCCSATSSPNSVRGRR